MSSVIPDTVSPSLFIFSAAISACLTRAAFQAKYARRIPTDIHFGKSLSSLHPGCRTSLPHLLRGIIHLNSSVPYPHLLCSTQQYHKGFRKSREKLLFYKNKLNSNSKINNVIPIIFLLSKLNVIFAIKSSSEKGCISLYCLTV